MKKIFIDGKEGTTGLRIFERLDGRDDISLLTLCDEDRKNPVKRREMINSADIVFLCLPDDAAREAVSMLKNETTKIIDASTAHRTENGWSYGFPELSEDFRKKIEKGRFSAVPGCHASGFNSIVYPLTSMGIMPKSYPVNCFSLTGYSGGGKQMIAEYENKNERSVELDSPRQYALTQSHKHLKEMKHISMLENEPLFSPIVADFYSGMQVSIPIYTSLLTKKYTMKDIHKVFCEHYKNSAFIKITPLGEEKPFMAANMLSGKDGMLITISGNDERVLITSTFDNLGKGASGAAVQCMNIMMNADETTGLEL